MIRRIWSALIASITPQSPAPSQPPEPSQFKIAKQAYLTAKNRKDTRAVHAAVKALRSARHEDLKLEVSRGRRS